jgi:6-phosphogluconolactonase
VTERVRVYADAEALVAAAAGRIADAAAAAIRASGRFVIALAGGGTPRALYERLARPPWATRIDWARVHVCFGDERAVPPDDPASNYRMAREALLAHVLVPATYVHRLHGEDQPQAAAAAYERELRALLATPSGPPRTAAGARFDLVLLGMGDNGHTASLFPHRPTVRERTRWVAADYVPEVSMWRLTLTPVVLDAAAAVVFLVVGGAKAAMLARVLDGPRDPDALPAQVVAPSAGSVEWLVDAAAGARLRPGRVSKT